MLVAGIPYISPYNVNSFLNPLLVQVMAQGYLFNLLPRRAAREEGGDDDHHAPLHRPVRQASTTRRTSSSSTACSRRRATRWCCTRSYEPKFATNPAYIQMYRTGHAYHPTHPFFMWYWGEAGRQHLGRVIVVGADNEYIPKLLGWETARTMDEALDMAKGDRPAHAGDPRAARAPDPDGGRHHLELARFDARA